MYVGGRENGAVRHAQLTVRTNMQLHAEIPLLTLADLVHLGIPCLVGVLGGAWGVDDGGIHDGAGVDLGASRLQLLPDFGKPGFAQLDRKSVV